MNDVIIVSYDNSDKDMPAITCMRKQNDDMEMLVGYVGNEADELYRVVTQQGYLKDIIEKQTPKKLVSLRKIKKFDGYTMGRCPCCNENLDDSFIENMKYCYICGQAIDWNEEEDEYEDDCPYI